MIRRACYRCGRYSRVFRYGIIDICVDCFLRLFGSRRTWSLKVFMRLLEGKSVFALISGGKDSLVATAFTKEIIDKHKVNCRLQAIHVNTGISVPGVEDYVRRVCRDLGVELIVLRPEKSFEDYVREHGIPSVSRRWCCQYLKMEPIRRYVSRVEGEKILVDGVRRAESPRRAKRKIVTWFNYFPCPTVSPILYWSNYDVEAYIWMRGLPVNPVYSVLNMSGECICGVFMTRRKLLRIKENYPEIFQRLLNIEKSVKTGWTFFYRNGKRIPLSEL
jgi:3'-phosphoadenosine 5'-phosphosulfate sulfotransferase (PAPS reductase)/FAD synthetase